ncbi:LTA synthase family protein [Pseudomonas sp. PDM11]|uniref:LTA synthase family protein n=1 Tax=Pseudomonas sp. PDM11 TaxID=2769309 RepID=UPI00178190F8|nr:LTA synthase family protein [Pseudomonas sp. PDM11]MBD9397535.1 LTA synthase family protein [Pseudomonas sp. PDM11]
MPQLRYAQLRYLAIVLLAWTTVFLLTRGALLIAHWSDASAGPLEIQRIFAVGLVYDMTFLLYAALPLGLYLLLCPQRLWRSRAHGVFLHLLLGISLFVMLFTATAEWLFWDEFGVRFNFIAVDYLVYSEEVINNILESYPVYPLIAALALVAVFLAVALRSPVSRALNAPLMPRKSALGAWSLLLAVALLATLAINQNVPRGLGGNAYQNELASNGPFQFFAAFRNNELDYMKFYATLPDEKVGSLLRQEVAESNARFVNDDAEDIRRVIDNPGPEQRHNVVLVTVESLSARYLGAFGDTRGLTPNLDALSKQSLFFSNLYATGTRTDRGLEAITLSMPPTPGRSIVKRIGRESGYASLGQQFRAKGYDSVFIYGGRGYFDNMNAFFGGNGYRIVDQSSVPSDEMVFQNAWGMSDEDLYAQTLRVADVEHAAGKPFFLQLMTTSNHRPYTYPEGRIDIPSGKGRDGALKYTDYAIGRFLAEAKSKPWFANTLFVFVADHTAGSAGKEDLPVANYHIPLFIYAPGIITPAEVTRLTSQIDIAPTLLGLLGFDYTSTFFGHNVLRDDAPPGRALIGNYQHLGLFDGQNLAILSPKRAMRRHDDALGISREQTTTKADPLMARDIAYYQGASHGFTHDLLSWQPDQSAAVAVKP